jgi:hypothetical protein
MDHKISPHPSLPKKGAFTEEGDHGFPLGNQEEFFGGSSDLWVLEFIFSKGQVGTWILIIVVVFL